MEENKQEKITGGEIAYQNPILKWLDNFWYHHKWTVIVVLFFAFTLTVCFVQCSSNEPTDLTVSFAGGKLLYVIENFRSVKDSGLSFDGLSLFGAIIAVPAVALLGAKMLKMPYGALLDYCDPLGLILLIFVRIGCFISGCCGAFTIWSGENPIILPVQLFEVVIDLVILDAVQSCEKRYEKRGVAYPLLVTLYGFARFFLELLRKPQGESLDHSSKILAAACFFVGGAVVFLLIKRIKGERSIKNKNS
jgi:prolipoprotein diacylglyceryltransferase